VQVYAGWRISEPALFRERFRGSIESAQLALNNQIRNEKSAVVGRHPFRELISTDPNSVRIPEIEGEILTNVQAAARTNYGIEVRFLGIERLGLPQSITQKVFDRMKEERQRFVQRLQADGDAQASDIRSAANRDATNALNEAQAQVIKISGKAEADAANALAVFRQNPDLAIFLVKLRALEDASRENATFILNPRTPPYDLIEGAAKAAVPGNKQ
jgi:membrane protease subunit HflC